MIYKKFDKIRHKVLFYQEVEKVTGRAYNTIVCKWFNQTQGFSIPEDFKQDVIKCLDNCLEYEQKERELKFKYFSK